MQCNRSAKLLSVIVLVSVLSLVTGVPMVQTAIAHPTITFKRSDDRATLPRFIVNQIRRDLSRRVGVPLKELRIQSAEMLTWKDNCLELPAADEFCGQSLVEGWQVVVAKKQQAWVYHTDREGRVLRLVSARPIGSDRSKGQAIRIPVGELPPPLPQNVVLRTIASGGFAGQTYQTLLFSDGRMIRSRVGLNGESVTVQTVQVSRQQMRQLQQTIAGVDRFDRLSYPAASGSADVMTVTLSTRSATVQYADSDQSQLPQPLRTLISAWNDLDRDS
jgi:hypothetical protein